MQPALTGQTTPAADGGETQAIPVSRLTIGQIVAT
jgi:hypothetical protein